MNNFKSDNMAISSKLPNFIIVLFVKRVFIVMSNCCCVQGRQLPNAYICTVSDSELLSLRVSINNMLPGYKNTCVKFGAR